MESWELTLGKMLKDRDNKPAIEAASAKVISPLPNLSVSLGDEIILDEDSLIVANRIYQLDLKPGQEVILLPTAGGQIFYLIDKVGS